MGAFSDSVKDKIGKCASTKELLDKLQSLYTVENVIEEPDVKSESNSFNENGSNIEDPVIMVKDESSKIDDEVIERKSNDSEDKEEFEIEGEVELEG